MGSVGSTIRITLLTGDGNHREWVLQVDKSDTAQGLEKWVSVDQDGVSATEISKDKVLRLVYKFMSLMCFG
jgi:hypothetical protein